jgi:hypothetical protein
VISITDPALPVVLGVGTDITAGSSPTRELSGRARAAPGRTHIAPRAARAAIIWRR